MAEFGGTVLESRAWRVAWSCVLNFYLWFDEFCFTLTYSLTPASDHITFVCLLSLQQVGARVGVRRCSDGTMHVCLNGEDLGVAASNIPKVLMSFYLFILNTLEMQYSTPEEKTDLPQQGSIS